MVETDLRIGNDSGSRIRVAPTKIRADGALGYPRLIVPIDLDFKPISVYGAKEKKPYTILGIRGSLSVQDNSQKIADAQFQMYSDKIPLHPYNISRDLEFPLDAYRIEKIEEQRKGADLKIRLDLYFIIGIYESLTLESEEGQQTKDFLTEIQTSYAWLSDIKIPQSHWVKDILPKLGCLEYLLVEVPRHNKIIREAWNYLERAESAFMRWDTQGVFTNCREVGCVLDNTIKSKFGETDSNYTERWGRFYTGKGKGFTHWASLDLHRAEIKADVKKADAAHLMLVTKSMIKFAEELVQEK